MKRLAVIGLAVVAVLALAAVAVAQYAVPVITTTGKVTPTKGGSKKKPKNGSITSTVTVNKESRVTASQITLFLPKNVKVDFTGFRYCPASQINSGGNCNAVKKVGSGSATALLGPNQTPLQFTTTVYPASKKEITIVLKGSVSVPAFRGIISPAGGNFGQKITIPIPPQVQQPINGLYSSITGFTNKLGPVTGSVKKKGKTVKTLGVAVTGCPKEKAHHLGVRIDFAPNPNPPAQGSATASTTSKCKP